MRPPSWSTRWIPRARETCFTGRFAMPFSKACRCAAPSIFPTPWRLSIAPPWARAALSAAWRKSAHSWRAAKDARTRSSPRVRRLANRGRLYRVLRGCRDPLSSAPVRGLQAGGLETRPLRSRERKRAVAGTRSKFVRLEHGHGIALLPDDILYGRRNVLWLP